jgi:hypothetical protein
MPIVLKAMIYKYRKSFGEANEPASPMLSPNGADKSGKSITYNNPKIIEQVRMPQLSMVEVTDPNTLFGLPYRTVAFQSLLFLQEALLTLKPDLSEGLPKGPREKNLNDFYTNTVDTIPDLVRFMYRTLAFKFIDVFHEFNSNFNMCIVQAIV